MMRDSAVAVYPAARWRGGAGPMMLDGSSMSGCARKDPTPLGPRRGVITRKTEGGVGSESQEGGSLVARSKKAAKKPF